MTARLQAAALEPDAASPLVLALPKGRILGESATLLAHAGIRPVAGYDDEDSRQLRFATEDLGLDVVRVRSFDVANFRGVRGRAVRHLRRRRADGVRLSEI